MIRLEISFEARAGVAKKSSVGERKTGLELDGYICAYIVMEMYVLCKLSDYLQTCFYMAFFFVKQWNFVKESVAYLNMSAKREHKK